jgi:hypothetical protein
VNGGKCRPSIFSPVQQEYFQSPHPRFYKGRKIINYYQETLEKYGLEFENNDPKSTCGTQGVWSSDNMVITTPKKNNGKTDTNNFCASFEAGDIPYFGENNPVENTGWTVHTDTENVGTEANARFNLLPCGDSRFYNPTDDNPMKASLFLNCHTLPDSVKQLLYSRYKNLQHYHKNIEAMFKALIYQRIRCIRYYWRVERHLKDYDTDAEILGFTKNENSIRQIPDKKTIGYFENKRLGIKGLNSMRDAYVIALRDELKKYGCSLGEKISIDSTPLTALAKDTDAKYNAHYDRLMYKIHIVVDVPTNVPLFMIITSGTNFDGHYLIPILEKLHSLGIYPKKIYADEHYDTLENWATASVIYGVKCQINLAENAVFREDGKPESLQKEYQKLHRNIDFKLQNQIGFDEMLRYLLDHDKQECVGAYFRNQWYLEWTKRKMDLEKTGETEKKPRSKSEGLHGHIKENMMFEVFMDGRGMRYAERHANMILISLLVVALTRVQYGVLDGLTRIACLT